MQCMRNQSIWLSYSHIRSLVIELDMPTIKARSGIASSLSSLATMHRNEKGKYP